MKKYLLVAIIAIGFTGCTGWITGYQYSWDDGKKIYKVVKKGVTMFMTEEQIKGMHLDKADTVITHAYTLGTEGKLEDVK